MPFIQRRFNQIAAEVKVWMNNHIVLFCLDVITYSFPNPNAGLGNIFMIDNTAATFA